MKQRVFIWSLTGVTAVVGFLMTVQLSSRTPQENTSSSSSFIDLRTQIDEQTQEHQVLLDEISKVNAQVLQYQNAQGKGTDMLKALEADAATVSKEAGLTPVSGPGLTIKIEFNPSLPFDQSTQGLFNQTSDQEIGLIVNDLFANGATAISINGQRLVTTSSIRLVSGLTGTNTLQVNTVPIAEPYIITAVGDISRMQAILTINNIVPELNIMQEDCIITPHPSANGVTVAGYQGPLPGNFAKEVHHG